MISNLFLIPSPIGETNIDNILPKNNIVIISKLRLFITENIRTTRRFFVSIGLKEIIDLSEFIEINKHSNKKDIEEFIIKNSSNDIGLLSEAGVPCVADPGNFVVEIAQKNNFKIVPLIGPSSIILSLMASGLNGQAFTFHGYLPINQNEKKSYIKKIESESIKKNITQIFIETPFRNNQIFKDLTDTCNDNTNLCIAYDITIESETIITKKIKDWKKNRIDINKKPCIFLLNGF